MADARRRKCTREAWVGPFTDTFRRDQPIKKGDFMKKIPILFGVATIFLIAVVVMAGYNTVNAS